MSDDLTFLRITSPVVFQIVPRALFEQIEDIDVEGIDLIYKGYFVLDPLNWFVVIHDSDHKISGFFWAIVSVLEKRIVLYAVSIDKKHQSFKNEIQKRILSYLAELPVKIEYKNKIICETNKPKALEAYGWKRSKRILMEWTNNVLANSTIAISADKHPIAPADSSLPE